MAASCSHSNSSGSNSSDSNSLWIFAASSLSDVLKELGTEFKQHELGQQNNPKIQFQFAGSSSLVRQINEGAPADVLATANDAVLAELKIPNSSAAFAKSELVIAVALENPKNITQLRDLENDDLLIGQCLQEVPCGDLTQKIFAYLGSRNQLGKINADTYEPSARSTLSKLLLGELDVALIYEVDVIATNQTEERLLAIPINEVPQEIRQNNYFVAVVDSGLNSGSPANLFKDFLFTPEAQAILNRYGFILPN